MNFNQTNPLEYTKYTFGKSIKLRREELGISLRNLAKKLQMTPAYLSDIEKGKRPAPNGRFAKKDFMSKFIVELNIPEDQIDSFYTMASASRNYDIELMEYLNCYIYAKKTLILAQKINLSNEKWKEIFEQLQK